MNNIFFNHFIVLYKAHIELIFLNRVRLEIGACRAFSSSNRCCPSVTDSFSNSALSSLALLIRPI